MKKKILSLICCFAMVFVCLFTVSGCKETPQPSSNIWDGSIVEVSKAKNNVIEIETPEELAGLARSVNEGNDYEGITIKLTRNMDLNNIEWTPIGYGTSNAYGVLDNNDSYYFKGTFDGGNKTIKNLKITTFVGGGYEAPNAATGIGLFGHTFDATIKNLTIENANVIGNHFVAVVAGFALGTEITNVTVKGGYLDCVYLDDNDSGDKAGAIVGFACNSDNKGSYVRNCSVIDSTIRADRDAGYLIGCFATHATGAEPICVEEDNTTVGIGIEWNHSAANQGSSSTNITEGNIGRDDRLV